MTTPRTLIFVVVAFIWGSEWIATRALDLPRLHALTVRYAFAAIILAVIIAARRMPLPGARKMATLGLTGIAMMALPTLLTLWAAERISPGLLVVMLAMTPLFAALMEGRAGGIFLAPLIGGLAGTALIASRGLSFAPAQWTGAAAALAAGALIAVSAVYVKREFAAVQPVIIAAVQLGASAVCLTAVGVALEGRSADSWTLESASIEVILAVLGNALAYPLYYWLLGQLESFQLTAVAWAVTVVGVAEGLFWLRGTPSWRILAGIAITLASLAALLRSRRGDDSPLTLRVTSSASEG